MRISTLLVRGLGRYKRRSPFWFILVLTFGIVACDGSSSTVESDRPEDQLVVVATSTIIDDWTQRLVGDENDKVEIVGILDPGADPHIYEPVPADTKAMEDADLILYNGYNLEPGLIRLITSAGANAQRLAVGEAVSPLMMEKHGQSQADPHVWGSAENAVVMVDAIRDALIELDPSLRDTVTANAETYVNDLEALNAWIQTQTATISENQRRLVTTHDAFQYYAHAYGLEVTGTLIGISTEEQPSAQTVQQLVESVKRLQVPAIFAETTINPQLISTVAEESGVHLADQHLYSDSIGAPGSSGDSYITMMVANTEAIVQNLGGQVQPFDRQP